MTEALVSVAALTSNHVQKDEDSTSVMSFHPHGQEDRDLYLTTATWMPDMEEYFITWTPDTEEYFITRAICCSGDEPPKENYDNSKKTEFRSGRLGKGSVMRVNHGGLVSETETA